MDWNPEDYARNSSAQLEWARELLGRLDLSGTEAILDVGCGDGRVSSELARAVPGGHVMAIDSSPRFVAYAERHYSIQRYPNLRFEHMDAHEMVCSQKFDVIFSNAALHWVDDHPAFLAGVSRLLEPSGTLLVSCGGAGNAAGIVAAMEAVIQEEAWAPYFRRFVFPYFFYSTAEYARWLPAAGLTPSHLELIEKDMTHVGRRGLEGWVRTTWIPYTQCVPEHLRDRFLTRCVDVYLEEHPLDEAGLSHVRMVRLEIQAHL